MEKTSAMADEKVPTGTIQWVDMVVFGV